MRRLFPAALLAACVGDEQAATGCEGSTQLGRPSNEVSSVGEEWGRVG